MNLPTSPSVFRNRNPILEILKEYIHDDTTLLEIGSGTGEHAVYLAPYFPKTFWVTSDVKGNHRTIIERLKIHKLKNISGPETLQIGHDDFPKKRFDYVFTANTLHIMSWKENKTLFKLLGKRLREGALVLIYGPFNYNGDFTSASNKEFDSHLRERNPKSGIRSFEDIKSSLEKFGFKFLMDHQMPANNRLLVFERLKYSAK